MKKLYHSEKLCNPVFNKNKNKIINPENSEEGFENEYF
jgi:hypothetical protein